jgi:hypothetical protein
MRAIIRWAALIVVVFGLTLAPMAPAQAVLSSYACNPSSSTWNLEGAWPSGTVMESRACLREDTTTGLVQAYTQFRTRRGGTAILSDWDLNGTNGPLTQTYYTISGDISLYGYKASFGDQFDTSIVTLPSFWECKGSITGPVEHQGHISGVSANPNGTQDGASGYKSAISLNAFNDNPGCS